MFVAILALLGSTTLLAANKGDNIATNICNSSKVPPSYHVVGELVSVIIPTYNEENYIRPTLDAIIHQTYTPIEIVISDETQEQEGIDAIDAIAAEYDCKIVHSLEKNVAYGRNIGAEASSGAIVLFLDADCIMSQTFVEQLVDGLNRPSIKLSHGVDVFYNGNALRQAFRVIISNNKAIDFTTGKGVAMHRENFFEIGGYDVNLDPMQPNQHEDTDLGRRVKEKWGIDSIYLDRSAYVAEACRRPVNLLPHEATWDKRGYRNGDSIDGFMLRTGL